MTSPVRWARPRLGMALLALVATLLIEPCVTAWAADHPTDGFQTARPGYSYTFPADHGAHPTFQTEWWYYTGHVETAAGHRYGYQVTFFRRGMHPKTSPPPSTRSRWRLDDVYFAHLAVTDLTEGRFYFLDTISRDALGKAGADTGRLHVWIDRWDLSLQPDGLTHRLDADGRTLARTAARPGSPDTIGLQFDLTPMKAAIIHGTDGVSRKGGDADQASHYYSLTRLKTVGTLTVNGERHDVTGTSWMDHEFGSGDLSANLVGWDWFSLQLDSGEEVMLYRLRQADGRVDAASSGTWIDLEGRARHLPEDTVQVTVLDHWTSPASSAAYPSRWRLHMTAPQADLTIVPLLPDQELRTTHSTRITYWEGAVRVDGQIDGHPVTGRGYVELTGYAGRYKPDSLVPVDSSP